MGGIAQRIPRGAALLVVAAAALPRLLALAIEREQILEAYVEKSDVFARTLVSSGTFGFLPGSRRRTRSRSTPGSSPGSTGRSTARGPWSGSRRSLVAVVTALLVLAIGTHLASVRTGVLAALVATLHPYLVWHDIHVNREILDGLLAAAIVAARAARVRAALAPAARSALGAVTGLAILSNARLLLLPLVLAPYVAWRVRPAGRARSPRRRSSSSAPPS